MTTDYRKRAEEFVEHYSCEDPWYSCHEAGGCNDEITECDCGYESKLEKLTAAFQQIAQESRREENYACAKLIEEDSYVRTLGVRRINFTIDAAKAIRSRMIGPEPMEEK